MVLRIIYCDVSKINEGLGARKVRLVHEAGHVSWMRMHVRNKL